MAKNSISSVLLVLPWSPNLPGGVSVVVRNLARELSNVGASPVMVVDTWDAPVHHFDSERVLNFRFALFGALNLLGLIKGVLAFPGRIAATLVVLREYRVSVVNFHYPSLDALGIALLKRLSLFKGRLILSFHGTDVRRPESFVEEKMWRFVLNSVDGITACSGALASQVADSFGVDISRVSVIYNGVDTELFSASARSREVTGFFSPKQFLVSIGSYIPRKGHLVLLEAFSSIAEAFPELHLVIVGMDGSERQALVDRAIELGLDQRLICMVGLDPESVASVVANAMLCVQPSFAEPFGLAVIEAGACGVPVLASAVGGHLELISDNRTGFLFTPGDTEGCADVMRSVLGDPDLLAKVAESFRSDIIERYSWATCANGYWRLLDDCPPASVHEVPGN
jgi:glycosyltransferase involved in cell wall biosynthesis